MNSVLTSSSPSRLYMMAAGVFMDGSINFPEKVTEKEQEMLQHISNAVYSSSTTESVFACRHSHFLSPPATPLSLSFSSMATADSHHHRELQLCHSSSSSFKLFNPILACHGSRDSHETTYSLRFFCCCYFYSISHPLSSPLSVSNQAKEH